MDAGTRSREEAIRHHRSRYTVHQFDLPDELHHKLSVMAAQDRTTITALVTGLRPCVAMSRGGREVWNLNLPLRRTPDTRAPRTSWIQQAQSRFLSFSRHTICRETGQQLVVCMSVGLYIGTKHQADKCTQIYAGPTRRNLRW